MRELNLSDALTEALQDFIGSALPTDEFTDDGVRQLAYGVEESKRLDDLIARAILGPDGDRQWVFVVQVGAGAECSPSDLIERLEEEQGVEVVRAHFEGSDVLVHDGMRKGGGS